MKKLLLMSLMAVFCFSTVSAQKTVVSKKNQKVYDVVEQMPAYTPELPAHGDCHTDYLNATGHYQYQSPTA